MADHQAAAGQHLLQRRWTRQQEVDPGLLQVVHVCGIVHVALGIHVAPAQRATITVSHLCALLARSRSRNAVVVALHELRPTSARSARGRSSVITPPIGAARSIDARRTAPALHVTGLPFQSRSYMPARTSAYFCSTALRRTFWLGVTSPSSTLSSLGSISNFLTVSQRSSCLLPWAT